MLVKTIVRTIQINGIAALLMAVPGITLGQGDPERGRILGETCLGCHGIQGYSNAYPNYRVPKLAGQYGEYVVASLNGYRNGGRKHDTMHGQATSMSDQDIQDIGAWVASLGTLEAQEPVGTPPETASTCVACHGQAGVSLAFAFPHLAGQHEDYLVQALKQYKAGERSDVSMAAFLATLTDEQMQELAAFYASQPGLETLSR